jgi:DNA-binding transcriptional ArsR family regulator
MVRRMSNALSIATVARLIGDPARANMLAALMGGMALTASELAREAGVSASTASGHLAKLVDGGLALCLQQGRHRYYRLAGHGVAEVLESLMEVSVRGVLKQRIGPKEQALRQARVCYDHLAGAAGVRMGDGLVAKGHLAWRDQAFALTPSGRGFLCAFGIDMDAVERQRRPLCRACLDWSERRPHLGGGMGAALLARLTEIGWLRRSAGSRAVQVTPAGMLGMQRLWPGADAATPPPPPSAACPAPAAPAPTPVRAS